MPRPTSSCGRRPGRGAGRRRRRWSTSAGEPTDVDLPGVLTVRVLPGAPAADSPGDARRGARASWPQLLDEAGVADVAAARALDAAAARAVGVGRSAAGHPRRAARRRLRRGAAGAPRRAARCASRPTWSVTPRRHGPNSRPRRRRTARQWPHATSSRESADVGGAGGDRAGHPRGSAAAEKLATARTESPAVAERLATQRESPTDDQLVIQAEAEAERAARARGRELAAVEAELAAAAPAAVAAELADATRGAGQRRARATTRSASSCVRTTAQLRVYGTRGPQGPAGCGPDRTASTPPPSTPGCSAAPGRRSCCAR